MNKNDISNLFAAMSALIKQMNDVEFAAFLDRALEIKFQQKKKLQDESPLDISAYENVTISLDKKEDRESARNILLISPIAKTRESLERYAKHLSIHINKTDKKDEIIDKIIESRVGSRLRTEAIKAINLGSGSPMEKKE